MSVEYVVKAVKCATDEEIHNFKEKVLLGNQVKERGLTKRIQDAAALVFVYDGDELIATGALKDNLRHQRTIALQSGVDLPQAEYAGEVGYLYVNEAYRRNRIGSEVVKKIITAANGRGVFATAQSQNKASIKVLTRCGFVAVGQRWQSEKGDDEVGLYVLWKRSS
mgnify:CR=1 FL=1